MNYTIIIIIIINDFQILTNVLTTHMIVSTSATTLRGPISAVVNVGTHRRTTEGLVQTGTSVHWVHTTANSCA